jgi:hypothetical protein
MSAQPNDSILAATARGQYTLVDSGDEALRYVWVELFAGDSRVMAAFHLATDALQLLAHYQRRETAERRQL